KLGVLGGGQLGRMLALAGYPLGLRFRFLNPAPGPPGKALLDFSSGRSATSTVLAPSPTAPAASTSGFRTFPSEPPRPLTPRPPSRPPAGPLRRARTDWPRSPSSPAWAWCPPRFGRLTPSPTCKRR